MNRNNLGDLDAINPKKLLTQEESDDLTNIFDRAGFDGWMFDSDEGTVKLVVKVVNKSRNPLPKYQKEGDSGFDFMANLPENETISIKQFERKLIPTGLFYQLPAGFELQIRPRSGLALNNGITVLNSPATIDSGYRGEIFVLLYNTDPNTFVVKNGDRIAQGVIVPLQYKKTIYIKMVDGLDKSDRGDGKFGHTGV